MLDLFVKLGKIHTGDSSGYWKNDGSLVSECWATLTAVSGSSTLVHTGHSFNMGVVMKHMRCNEFFTCCGVQLGVVARIFFSLKNID